MIAVQDEKDSCDISLLAFDQYMRQVRWTDRLCDEEERRLLVLLREGQRNLVNGRLCSAALAARDQLVASYQPLVVSVARRFCRRCRSMEFLDLVQEANIGLVGLLDRLPALPFDIRDVHLSRFGAYVLVTLTHVVIEAIEKQDASIRLSEGVYELRVRLEKARRALRVQLDGDPSLDQIAAFLGERKERLQEVLELFSFGRVASLHALSEEIGEDHFDFQSLYQETEAALSRSQDVIAEAVQHAIGTVLTKTQRKVVCIRYGLGDDGLSGCSMSEAAERCGYVGKQSIAGIEWFAKDRLRKALAYLIEEERVS